MRAFPKLSPSILENYVTKDELTSKDYVNHTEFNETIDTTVADLQFSFQQLIKDFVKDVDNQTDGVIYGRQKGKWISLVDINDTYSGVVCWGMLPTDTIDAEGLLALKKQVFTDSISEYMVEDTPTENGYFWFASTTPIRWVIADNGLEYRQSITDAKTIVIQYQGTPMMFYCYRTQKLVALPGMSYKFKINLGE